MIANIGVFVNEGNIIVTFIVIMLNKKADFLVLIFVIQS